MKKLGLIALFLLFSIVAFSQKTKDPVEVTVAIEKKIASDIAKEADVLKAKLIKDNDHEYSIEFELDTFRVHRYMQLYINYDWTTAGMRMATYEAAAKYDSLLNKYYKRLMDVLKPEDKKALIAAQKAWLTFRDNERKLIDVIGKDEYSGGGTIQQLIDASEYLDLIEKRTITLFQHYMRATQSY
ncbi:DUF1311 domain-containing protein [Lacibacter luteus]|uniref:DUF1311 domain-containing protein n=1 Tax=Lacibacter luteus TaxID=2508719 RepID=A0A4Q1CKV2_9BACT|nr:lysozyme inhibitor LprI family protein [Lacibacter luteus]RXK61607.1 DUF1311 domain-containing protein [Lacibacter luteus]